MNLLCIAIDRLHTGYLGCYGNTWVATPAFDRLASTGFVFDGAIVDSLDLATTYDSLWRGQHALAGPRSTASGAAEPTTFAAAARRAGLVSLLASDDPRLFEHAAADDFDDALELPSFTLDGATADDVEATHAARAAAAFSERLEDLAQPFAVWLHLGTLGGAWDAPLEFRERFRDEEDPPVQSFTTLPERTLPRDDLDERFGFAQAYAGQLALVDACLGGVLEQLAESGCDADTAVVVFGLRGLALGEHGAVGFGDRRAYVENVQVPLIVRLPGDRGRLRRSSTLVQPCDLLPSLAELLGVADLARAEEARSAACVPSGFGRSWLPTIDRGAPHRDRALAAIGDGVDAERLLRTVRWSLRIPLAPKGETQRTELYVKPDDYWEVNDVADRLPEAVESLSEFTAASSAAYASGESPPPLPAVERLLDEG